jgi:carbon dioxide concentrating mechanism protein CcmO
LRIKRSNTALEPTAAVVAGQTKVEGLGKLIAAHVVARPSAAVLELLPKV